MRRRGRTAVGRSRGCGGGGRMAVCAVSGGRCLSAGSDCGMRLEDRRLPLLMYGPEDVPFLSFRAVALSAVFPPYLSHLSWAALAEGLFRCSFRSFGTADKTGTAQIGRAHV